MRRAVAIVTLIFGVVFSVFPQVSASSGPMDLVVLLDTSASMSDHYRETGDYLTGPFLKEFLRIGDTFHLIAFSGSPKLEISRRVEGIGDVETIIGRLLLMYPLDPGSDIPGALSFAERYVASIPGNRHRKIVLISDGDGWPQDTEAAVSGASERLSRRGADLQRISIPLTSPLPSSGRPAFSGSSLRIPPADSTQTPGQAAASSGQAQSPGGSRPSGTQSQTPGQSQSPGQPGTSGQIRSPEVSQSSGTQSSGQVSTSSQTQNPGTAQPSGAQTQFPGQPQSSTPDQSSQSAVSGQTPSPGTVRPSETQSQLPGQGETSGQTSPSAASGQLQNPGTSQPSSTQAQSPGQSQSSGQGGVQTQSPGQPQSSGQAGTPDQVQGSETSQSSGTQPSGQTQSPGTAQSSGSQARTSGQPSQSAASGQPQTSGNQPPVTQTAPPQTASGITAETRHPEGSQSSSPPVQSGQAQSAFPRVLGIPLPLFIALIILFLLALALIIFLISRRLHSSPNRVMAAAAASQDNRDRLEAERQSRIKNAETLSNYAENQKNAGTPPLSYPPPKSRPLPKDKPDNYNFDNGPPMLSLFVEDQNTAIGRRNIHLAKEGYSYTIGGGKSDFLIFLVPVPPHIGEVRFDGRQCTLIPTKPQYFPDIGSQQVPNCIGKTVRVISDKKYELFIRIERYEDPLKALNKLLHSIQVPG